MRADVRPSTPCEAEPELFDDDTYAPGMAVRACRTACPALAACREYALANPDIHGVIAGMFRPYPSTKHAARDRRRAEGAA